MDDEQPKSHAVKNVDSEGDISWGTPLTTPRTQKETPKPPISSLRERTPKEEPKETQKQREKYFYLNQSARPLHDLTSMNHTVRY